MMSSSSSDAAALSSSSSSSAPSSASSAFMAAQLESLMISNEVLRDENASLQAAKAENEALRQRALAATGYEFMIAKLRAEVAALQEQSAADLAAARDEAAAARHARIDEYELRLCDFETLVLSEQTTVDALDRQLKAAYDEQAAAAAAKAEVDEALAACERARAAAVAQCESLQASFANQQVLLCGFGATRHKPAL